MKFLGVVLLILIVSLVKATKEPSPEEQKQSCKLFYLKF